MTADLRIDPGDYADDPDVLVDVDGDGIPDRITSGAASKATEPAGTDVAVRPESELMPVGNGLIPIPVDKPARAGSLPAVLAAVLTDEGDRKPVLPSWLTDAAAFRAGARHVALMALHVTAWHLVRLVPHVMLVLGVLAPRGLYRGASTIRRWVADVETATFQQQAAFRGKPEDAKLHMALTRQRRNRSGWRWTLLVVAGVLAVVAAALEQAAAPSSLSRLIVVAVVLVLARLGRNPDQSLFGHAVVRAEAPKLSSVVLVRALQSLGIAALTPTPKRPADVQFLGEITRDGKGYRAEVDLPPGVTALEVIDRRDTLAGNLRRPLGCVWPEPVVTAHPGRLALFVADRDPSTLGPVKWALADKGGVSFFQPFHLGDSPQGRPVAISLFEHNVLAGSQPGQGKTSFARVLVAGVSLDPGVEMWLHELKGSGDLNAFEKVSHRFVSGITDPAVEYAAASLKLLRREVTRRPDALQKVPEGMRPDNKLTPDIAAHAAFKLRPLVCVIDECQNLFSHPVYGKEAAEDAEFIIKIGRAFGVVLILLTQRPDKDSLPARIASNVSIRFCLSVDGQVANDMILGTSSYKEGLRATSFRPGLDAGTGWLKGAGAEPVVVRTAYLDGPAAVKVADRALVLRTAAGTVTGHAAGLEPEALEDESRIVVDVLRAWTPGDDAMWTATLAARLAELEPARYGELADEKRGPVLLGARLRALGLEVKDRHRKLSQPGGGPGKATTKKGVALQDLEAHLVRQGRAAVAAAPEGDGDGA